MIWRLERKDGGGPWFIEGRNPLGREERGCICAKGKRAEGWNRERRKMACI